MILFGNQQNRSKLVTYGNGLLYNWYAVSQANFAPAGWHVPTDAEFATLANALGGASVAGGKMKSIRTQPTAAPSWVSPNTDATNISGFTGLPGGNRGTVGSFGNQAYNGYWWSSTQSAASNAWYRNLKYSDGTLYRSYNNQSSGFSVRLLKDDSTWTPGMVVTDLDGNKYPTVKIGNQVWLKSNWKCTKYNDGTAIPNVTNGTTWAGLTTGAYCSYLNQPIVEYTELF